MLQAIQIALNTSDMPGTLRLYTEVFGFSNAGAQAMWGPIIRVQGLSVSDRAIVWWMVGRQKLFQLEIFQHTQPVQRPLPSDWRPCDHGWVRFGVTVSDFDASLRALESNGVAPLASPVAVKGLRRVAFRDPYVGVIVEVMEASHGEGSVAPAVAYVASSVADIESARSFYSDVLRFEICPLEDLHGAEDEAIWAPGGAARDGFLVRAGDVFLEIVQYSDPVGRPRRDDHCVADQGIMNIALASRQVEVISDVLERARHAGYTPPYRFEVEGSICGYITEPGREIEFIAFPEEADEASGFKPAASLWGAIGPVASQG